MHAPEKIHLSTVPKKQFDEAFNYLKRAIEDGEKFCFRKLIDIPGLSFLYDKVGSNRNATPLLTVFRHARNQGANCILVEWPYLDMDFWTSFSLVHTRSFYDVSKYGWRLHFFKHEREGLDPIEELLYTGASMEDLSHLGWEYSGFTTIRPTTSFNIGRTVLQYNPPDTQHYLRSKSTQSANVGSSHLEVEGVPFLQQDPVVGMCATASIWSASQILSYGFGMNKFPFADITRYAIDSPGKSIPGGGSIDQFRGRGLLVEEICAVLRLFGSAPFERIPNEYPEDLRSAYLRFLIYTFIESKLPVILILRDPKEIISHAVTVVGHLHPNQEALQELEAFSCHLHYGGTEVRDRHLFVSQAMNNFLVHDDAFGPYRRMRLLSSSRIVDVGGKPVSQDCPVELEGQQNEECYGVTGFIAPVPPYVRQFPDGIIQDLRIRFTKLFGRFLTEVEEVIWRIFLVNTSDLRQFLKQDERIKNSELAGELANRYGRLHLPKLVWLCEASVLQNRNIDDHFGSGLLRTVCGHFLYDPTVPYYDVSPLTQWFRSYFVQDPYLASCDGKTITHQISKDENAIKSYDTVKGIPCFSGVFSDNASRKQ